MIAGTVNGSLIAEDRIELRSSARVEGELNAPRIAIADGAMLSGRWRRAGAQGAQGRIVAPRETRGLSSTIPR